MTAPEFGTAVLDALFASHDIALGVIDADLRYVRVNEPLAAANGVPAEDHIGRTVSEVLPDLAEFVVPSLQKILETGEPLVGLELSGPTPADPNADRHFVVSYYPVVVDGSRQGILAIVVEVTERVRFQRQLRLQSRQIYESIAQDLTVLQLALAQGDQEQADLSLQRALAASKSISSRIAFEGWMNE